MSVMTATEFKSKLLDVVDNYNTLYVMGCFGAPLTGSNVERYKNNHSYNMSSTRQAMIDAVADKSPPYYGFDCVCLIKGILWGWDGTESATYGGASYNTNGVPDVSADQMISLCTGVTTDFSDIPVGAALWCSGHIGVYIGEGLAVECTPSWDNNVQITAVKNQGEKSGYNNRTWTKWGLLPYIDYTVQETEEEEEDMDVSRFKELWTEMRQELQDNDSSDYSEEAREWAVSTGLVAGSSTGEFNGMWEDVMTREQLVTVLLRFAKLMGMA